MKRRNLIVLAALASCMATWAQTYEKTDNGVKFQTASPVLNGEVVFYAPSIVRVVKYPSAEMPEKYAGWERSADDHFKYDRYA